MNADKRIYFLKPKSYDVLDEVYADLISGQQKCCYYISLEQTSNEPRDIFMCDTNFEIAETKNEEHNICFYGGAESYHGLFISKIFADTEEYALRKAIHIRNEAIESGEGDRAWERHKLDKPIITSF